VTKRIEASDLPEFDPTPYLDSETAIAAYLTDILKANDPALLASALGVIDLANEMRDTQAKQS